MKFTSMIVSLIYVFRVNYVYSESNCCDPDVHIIIRNDIKRCENGRMLSISCVIEPSDELDDFEVETDSKGEYVNAVSYGYITRSPHFCTGKVKSTSYDGSTRNVAIACSENKIWYQKSSSSLPFPERVMHFLWEMFNLFSTITLAITAFVYAFLRDLRDSQEVCTFHFSLVTCLLHASFFYVLALKSDGILPNMCITNLYVEIYIILSSFTWCTIMGYNSWIRAKNVQHIIDESKMLKWYRYIGYGLPVFVVLISNGYAHGIRLYEEFRMEMECTAHQNGLFFIVIVLPVIISSLANLFFFVDLQRRLWNSPTLELRSEKSTLRKLKYRLLLNGKLFFILGMSWLTLFFFILLRIFYMESAFVINSIYFSSLLVSGQGIMIFLLLVCFRKRVLRNVTRTWLTRFKIFPVSWRNAKDSETCEEHVDDTLGQTFIPFDRETTTHPSENTHSETVNDKTSSEVGTLSA